MGQIKFKTLIIISLLYLAVNSCNKTENMVDPGTLNEAPDFSLKSLDGSEVKLSDFENRVVVLFFFGNNCPSCKAASPDIQSMLVTEFEAQPDYVILGLDQWDGNAASVEAFKTTTGVTFPLLLNASGVASSYKTTYDRLVVIDKDGKIAFSGKQTAASDLSAAKGKVEMLIDKSLGMKPDTTTVSKGNAPEFTLASLDGKQVSLSDYKNKVVVLFFLGYNCPYCKTAVPDVESKLITPFAARTDYQLLGLDQWNGTQDGLQAFKTSTGATFPLLKNAASVAAEYKTTYDRLVVVDKNGNIAFSGKQGVSSDVDAVKSKVETLLSGK